MEFRRKKILKNQLKDSETHSAVGSEKLNVGFNQTGEAASNFAAGVSNIASGSKDKVVGAAVAVGTTFIECLRLNLDHFFLLD